MKHEESDMQRACVKWFRLQYPSCVVFAVPNGGARNRVTGAVMKAEGVLAGVADLVIVAPGRVFFVELKTQDGRLRDTQRDFADAVRRLGHEYAVCRSFDEFRDYVSDWMKFLL